jgi:MYXO-CTERM domain-containing protein
MRVAPLVLVALLAPAPASAYVRAVTATGAAWHWDRPTLTLDVQAGQPDPRLSSEELVQAVAGAAAPWSQPALACTSVQLTVVGHPEATAPIKRDGVNRLVFRRDQWCPDPRAPGEPCYNDSILALTTSQVEVNTGRIAEADIEVNAVDHDWSDLVARPGAFPGAMDLQNALTHELGHFLGFAHSCLLMTDELSRTDDQGQPVPLCREASQAARESTMVATISENDVDRRTLTADDERGVCDVYPKGITRGVNQQPAPGGCAVGSGPAPPPWVLVLVLVLVLGPLGYRRLRASPPHPSEAEPRDRPSTSTSTSTSTKIGARTATFPSGRPRRRPAGRAARGCRPDWRAGGADRAR